MLTIIQEKATQPQIQIAQETVIAIIAASTVVVLGLLWLIGRFVSRAPEDPGPLHYGNFFVVIFGLMTALIGFLIAFPLVVSGVFSDPTQVIALLSALFGTIVGLVGTYFGIKSSSDASQHAQDLSQRAQDLAKEATRRNTGWTNEPPDGPASGMPNGAATVPTSKATPEGSARPPTAAHPTAGLRNTDAQGDNTDPEPPSQEES